MTGIFGTYDAAFKAARANTNKLNQAHYIEKRRGLLGETVYAVGMLPKPENRFGWELRVEAVEPEDVR